MAFLIIYQSYIVDNIEEKSGSGGQKVLKNVGHRRITVLCLSPNFCHEKRDIKEKNSANVTLNIFLQFSKSHLKKKLSGLKIFRFSVAIVGSDPPAVTLESHEILCDNVIGTGGGFPKLFLA